MNLKQMSLKQMNLKQMNLKQMNLKQINLKQINLFLSQQFTVNMLQTRANSSCLFVATASSPACSLFCPLIIIIIIMIYEFVYRNNLSACQACCYH